MRNSFTHMTLEQRRTIRQMLDRRASKAEIAREIGANRATVYREIERGTRDGVYDPEYAEETYRRQLSVKGARPILLNDPALARHIADLILEEKLSLSQVLVSLRDDKRFSTVPKSRMTLYSAIDAGLIPGVTRESLNPASVLVSRGGQIRLAQWARNQLGIREGDRLNLAVEGDCILLRKAEEAAEDAAPADQPKKGARNRGKTRKL